MRRMACRRPANDGTRTRNRPAVALGLPDQQRALDRPIADRHFPTRSALPATDRGRRRGDSQAIDTPHQRTIDFIATD
jgi:hypothetical protein